MKKVSIFNIKGGVAKTTSALNMAASLSQQGKKVLLVDLDAQANATMSMKAYDMDMDSVTDVLLDKAIKVENVIKETEFENIDILPSNIRLVVAERKILLDVSRSQQNRLKKALESVEDKYDYCIIDCPPNLNMVTINALVASNQVLVPIKIDKYSLDGLEYLLDSIEEITEEFNNELEFKGCFITMDTTTTVNKVIKNKLYELLGDKMLKTSIRNNVKVIESTFSQSPVCFYSPKSRASLNYKELVREVFDNE